MDTLLAESARELNAEFLFELVRRNYHDENKDYLQKQINIAMNYLTEDQKKWLTENGYQC